MHCIIVRRGDYQQYDVLYKAFGSRVPIIWDRRRGERRTAQRIAVEGDAPADRRADNPPASWVALGFVVVWSEKVT